MINYKIVTIGEAGVGKTSINIKFTTNECERNMSPTSVANFFSKDVVVRGESIKVGIWDTAGQEKYRSIVPMFFKNAHGIMLVFDITNRYSFEEIPFWFDMVNKYSEINSQMILVGNKSDLQYNRKVSSDEIDKFCDTHNFTYFETSCKDNANINEAFSYLTYQINENFFFEESQSHAVSFIGSKPQRKCC